MPLNIRDPETEKVVRELAARKGVSITEAVRLAAANELDRLGERRVSAVKQPFLESIRDIQERIAAYPKTGLKADKAFYDELSGDLH